MAPQEKLVAAFVSGATTGVKGALSIAGDDLVSFGWYPIARRVEKGFWVRRQMYSEATALHIKTVKRVLATLAFVEVGEIDEPTKDRWWLFSSTREPHSGS